MKVRKKSFLVVTGSLILLIGMRLSSCSGVKTVPPAHTIEMPGPELHEGRILFNDFCATCHPEAKASIGPSLINKPLPEFLIRFQIRNGIGVMPGFDEQVLSDDEVEKIAEYLVYLRKQN